MSVPSILDPLLPVLALSALGFALSWLKSLPPHWDQTLAEVAAKILLPCLLFEGASRSGLSRGAGGGSLLAFYGPVLLLFGIVAGLANHRRWNASIPFASVYSNTVIIGVPVLMRGLGPASLAFAFPIIAFHSLVTFTLYQLLAAHEGQHAMSLASAIGRAVRTPVVASLLLGLLANAARVTLPPMVATPLSMLSAAAIPCALIALGASLRRMPVRWSPDVAVVVVAKLVALPALVYCLAVWVLAVPRDVAAVLVMLAACPVGVNAFALVNAEREDPSRVGAAIFVSTAAATVTIPFWLALCHRL